MSAVTKNYRDPETNVYFQALRGIDLSIREGSFCSIIGPSGAGKSTLLNILGGMAKVSTGEVVVDSLPIHLLDQEDLVNYRRSICGFLWQNPDNNLLPNMTMEDNIIHTMQVAGYPRKERKERARELLKSVGLEHRMDHKLGQVSGGEAQRAGLATALANNPRILLADEPTGELDSETTVEIIDYLKNMSREYDVTVVVVTHDHRFERSTDNSFNIIDGTIAGYRVAVDKTQDWKSSVREEFSVVNQFGMVKLPPKIKEELQITNYMRFIKDETTGRYYIEKVDEDEVHR